MVPDFVNVSACFLVKNKKVLIAQRKENDDMPLKWEFPGGSIKEDEDYDAALIREIKEELGIDINVIEEVGSSEVNHNGKVLMISFFLADGDVSNITLKAHKEYKFVSLNELKNLDLCDADKEFIKNYELELKNYIN